VSSRRIERVNDLLRAEISDLIAKEIKDPGLQGMISVTEVESSPDLRHAKVYVSVLGTDEERSSAIRTLARATGFFRKELGQRVTIKRIPELAFILDTSIEHGDKIMRLLRQVQEEDAKRQGEGTEAKNNWSNES
jgi:ribosome-binding factor A